MYSVLYLIIFNAHTHTVTIIVGGEDDDECDDDGAYDESTR